MFDRLLSGWRCTVTAVIGCRSALVVKLDRGGEGALRPQFESAVGAGDALAKDDRADMPFAHRAQAHHEAASRRPACRSGRDAARSTGSSARRRHRYIRGRNRRRSAACASAKSRLRSSSSCCLDFGIALVEHLLGLPVPLGRNRRSTRCVFVLASSSLSAAISSTSRSARPPGALADCQPRWNGRSTTRDGSA